MGRRSARLVVVTLCALVSLGAAAAALAITTSQTPHAAVTVTDDPVIRHDLDEELAALTPPQPDDPRAQPRANPALEAEFDRIVAATDRYRFGAAYVSMVHLDTVNERLLVGIDGGTHADQVQLARTLRADTNVPTEFFTASAGASDL